MGQAAKPSEQEILVGRLSPLMLGDMLQFLGQVLPVAVVRVEAGASRSGELWLRGGAIVHARFGHLEGEEAGLAALMLRRGTFAVEVSQREPLAAGVESLTGLLLESVRLEDELERRRDNLLDPFTEVTCRVPSVHEDELQCGAPMVARALTTPRTPASLEATLPLAPSKIQLALAWLRERGVLNLRPSLARFMLEEKPPSSSSRSVTWLHSALEEHRGALRVLVGCSSSVPLDKYRRVLRDVASAVHAEEQPFQPHASGPSFVRLRPRKGGVLSFTFLPLSEANRVFFESFTASTDVVILGSSELLAQWKRGIPSRVRSSAISDPENEHCLLDALRDALAPSQNG